jgi:3-deoxy-7-phosphoheptulonate synthase
MSKKNPTDDLKISSTKELITPKELITSLPMSKMAVSTVVKARNEIIDILDGSNKRLLLIVGPCSIHDVDAATDYAGRLLKIKKEVEKNILVVMRVYFEKPRTVIGWKGLINDPELDNSFQINKGIKIARKLLLDFAEMGMPSGHEYLDLISPQYLSDIVSWGAIGARTTESQTHRELASGLSCPVGFKNGTDGSIQIAVDAIKAASGHDKPEASSLWVWLSVVLAPIAPQLTISDKYCGLIKSKYSWPDGMPISAKSNNSFLAIFIPLFI